MATHVATVAPSCTRTEHLTRSCRAIYIAGNEFLMSKQKRVSMETLETAWICHCLLKNKLTTAPVLAFETLLMPALEQSCCRGKMMESSTQLHTPAVCSLRQSITSVTELETLPVVWALTRFHHYLHCDRGD